MKSIALAAAVGVAVIRASPSTSFDGLTTEELELSTKVILDAGIMLFDRNILPCNFIFSMLTPRAFLVVHIHQEFISTIGVKNKKRKGRRSLRDLRDHTSRTERRGGKSGKNLGSKSAKNIDGILPEVSNKREMIIVTHSDTHAWFLTLRMTQNCDGCSYSSFSPLVVQTSAPVQK